MDDPERMPLEAVPRRYRRVVAGLALGLTNAELATAVNLEQHTIEAYVSELAQLLGSNNRGRLALTCAAMIDEPGG